MKSSKASRLGLAVLAGVLILAPAEMNGHCDTMNGPVVVAAQKALDQGDVRLALIWVRAGDEAEVRSLFEKVLAVRTGGGLARSISDRLFLETVVRLHRAGEGVPYTGIRDSGEPLEPGIAEAEASINARSVNQLSDSLTEKLRWSLEESFRAIQSTQDYHQDDVESGRRYVEAYVRFIHKVEALYGLVTTGLPEEPGDHDRHTH